MSTLTDEEIERAARSNVVFMAHEKADMVAFARAVESAIFAKQREQSEPAARLLHWKAPAHIPAPHGGTCARTFAEFPVDTPCEQRYWFEGAPLYTHPQPLPEGLIWQPIETAPRDCAILLSDGHNVNLGQWVGRYFAWGYASDPTYWMRLPKPPIAAAEKEAKL